MEYLLKYASTERQREAIEAYIRNGCSSHKAAAETGIDDGHIRRVVRTAKARAARQGYAPEHDMTHAAPDGFQVKGTSTLYGPEGEIKAQWVKTDQDKERQFVAMQAAVEALKEDIRPAQPVKPKIGQKWLKALLNQYTITDYHLGMYAWSEETGADWDSDIAEDMLVAWFERAISLAPQAETAIFAQLGDFLHYDGLDSITPTSGHILDADTRFQRVVRIAIRVTRRIISMLLDKHRKVHVIMAEGNHDMASSIWLRELLAAFYAEEPRVTVDVSPLPYYCYEHGLTALFYHHGHKKKLQGLDSVFAGMFRDVYGRTKHAYAHTGHLHSDVSKETNLMKVEQHRTLAAPDAYASRGGWISGRDAKVITYHKEHGEVSRLTISPEMLQ